MRNANGEESMGNMTLKCDDAFDALSSVGDCRFDLTVTSPPYDSLRKYGDDSFEWNHTKFLSIAKELYRTTKDGGVVVWVVGDQTVGGSETGTSYRQVLSFMDIGFRLNDTMIFRKKNPMPEVRQPRYAQCFEFMFVLSKGKPKTFNPIMRECKCAGQSYDSTCKNMGGESGRTKKHFSISSETVDYNVWDIAVAQNKTGHTAVFPEELARRHVLTWSNEGDAVLDPFMGSGTVGIVCGKTNRDFFGIEKNEEYFALSERRILESVESAPRM